MGVSRADEIAILSCVHEGIYDFVNTVSHEIAFNLPREPSNGLQNEDRVIFHRFGGAPLWRCYVFGFTEEKITDTQDGGSTTTRLYW